MRFTPALVAAFAAAVHLADAAPVALTVTVGPSALAPGSSAAVADSSDAVFTHPVAKKPLDPKIQQCLDYVKNKIPPGDVMEIAKSNAVAFCERVKDLHLQRPQLPSGKVAKAVLCSMYSDHCEKALKAECVSVVDTNMHNGKPTGISAIHIAKMRAKKDDFCDEAVKIAVKEDLDVAEAVPKVFKKMFPHGPHEQVRRVEVAHPRSSHVQRASCWSTFGSSVFRVHIPTQMLAFLLCCSFHTNRLLRNFQTRDNCYKHIKALEAKMERRSPPVSCGAMPCKTVTDCGCNTSESPCNALQLALPKGVPGSCTNICQTGANAHCKVMPIGAPKPLPLHERMVLTKRDAYCDKVVEAAEAAKFPPSSNKAAWGKIGSAAFSATFAKEMRAEKRKETRMKCLRMMDKKKAEAQGGGPAMCGPMPCKTYVYSPLL